MRGSLCCQPFFSPIQNWTGDEEDGHDQRDAEGRGHARFDLPPVVNKAQSHRHIDELVELVPAFAAQALNCTCGACDRQWDH